MTTFLIIDLIFTLLLIILFFSTYSIMEKRIKLNRQIGEDKGYADGYRAAVKDMQKILDDGKKMREGKEKIKKDNKDQNLLYKNALAFAEAFLVV